MSVSINVSKDLVNDPNISPECRFFLIYIFTNFSDNIHMPTIMSSLKKFYGKDRVYKLLKEAMQADYIHKYETFDRNLKRYHYELNLQNINIPNDFSFSIPDKDVF